MTPPVEALHSKSSEIEKTLGWLILRELILHAMETSMF